MFKSEIVLFYMLFNRYGNEMMKNQSKTFHFLLFQVKTDYKFMDVYQYIYLSVFYPLKI